MSATTRKKATGIRYSRTRSLTWLGNLQPPVQCHVSGRPALDGDPFQITGLPNKSHLDRFNAETRITHAIEAAGFKVPRHVRVDVFCDSPIKGMTGPLDLAMVIMALSASNQIQPVDWPTLIVGYIDHEGEFTACWGDLANAVYNELANRPGYQLICPTRLLELMPVNAQFEQPPIGLENLGEIRDRLVFTEPLP